MEQIYYNRKEAQKEYLTHNIPFDFVILIILVLIYFHDTDNTSWLLFSIVCVLYFFGRDIHTSFHICMYSLCTLTDSLFIFEYEGKALQWSTMKSLTVNLQMKTIAIMKRDASDAVTFVDIKWIEHENDLYENLKKICENRSISFTIT